MKKLIIEVQQVAANKMKSIDEVKNKITFQKKLSNDISRLSDPVGFIKESANNFAGAKGVAVVGAIAKVAGQALNQTMKSISFAISGVGMTTGNSSLQENIAREQEKITESVDMAKSIIGGVATGAIMGAAFGPIGAVVGSVGGAIFGGVSAEADKQRKYEERRREYEYASWKSDSARSVSLQRAGVVLSNGRLHQF